MISDAFLTGVSLLSWSSSGVFYYPIDLAYPAVFPSSRAAVVLVGAAPHPGGALFAMIEDKWLYTATFANNMALQFHNRKFSGGTMVEFKYHRPGVPSSFSLEDSFLTTPSSVELDVDNLTPNFYKLVIEGGLKNKFYTGFSMSKADGVFIPLQDDLNGYFEQWSVSLPVQMGFDLPVSDNIYIFLESLLLLNTNYRTIEVEDFGSWYQESGPPLQSQDIFDAYSLCKNLLSITTRLTFGLFYYVSNCAKISAVFQTAICYPSVDSYSRYFYDFHRDVYRELYSSIKGSGSESILAFQFRDVPVRLNNFKFGFRLYAIGGIFSGSYQINAAEESTYYEKNIFQKTHGDFKYLDLKLSAAFLWSPLSWFSIVGSAGISVGVEKKSNSSHLQTEDAELSWQQSDPGCIFKPLTMEFRWALRLGDERRGVFEFVADPLNHKIMFNLIKYML